MLSTSWVSRVSKSFKTSITVHGPWFTHDPAKTFAGNVHEMMLGLAREGAKDVQGQTRAGQSGREPIRQLGDHVSDHVAGELRRYPAGPRYAARVIVRNRGFTKAEGISLMAAASQVEQQTHAFRKTTGRIMRARAVNAAELAKGLA